jgi:hypothetical protein
LLCKCEEPQAIKTFQVSAPISSATSQRSKDEAAETSAPWGSPVTFTGHRKELIRSRDDQFVKELVKEGVDEAEHHQVVEARRARNERGNPRGVAGK